MPLESQADRRRAQLIRIAAALIENAGVDALTMASVAELAGCTRTQVHRYFAKREDLLAAVVFDFNERLRVLIDGDGVLISAITEQARAKGGGRWSWAADLHRALWTMFEDGGMAGLILLAIPHASAGTRDPIDKLRREQFAPWIEYVARALGSPDDAELVVELWMTTAYRIATKWKAGELEREHAIDVLSRTQLGILEAFTSGPGGNEAGSAKKTRSTAKRATRSTSGRKS